MTTRTGHLGGLECEPLNDQRLTPLGMSQQRMGSGAGEEQPCPHHWRPTGRNAPQAKVNVQPTHPDQRTQDRRSCREGSNTLLQPPWFGFPLPSKGPKVGEQGREDSLKCPLLSNQAAGAASGYWLDTGRRRKEARLGWGWAGRTASTLGGEGHPYSLASSPLSKRWHADLPLQKPMWCGQVTTWSLRPCTGDQRPPPAQPRVGEWPG